MSREENSVLMSLRELKRIEVERIDEEERAARRAIELRRKAEQDKQSALERQRKKQERHLRELEARARAEAKARLEIEAATDLARARMELELTRATAIAEPPPSPIIPAVTRSRLSWLVSAILTIAVVAQGVMLLSMSDDRSALQEQIARIETATRVTPAADEPAPAPAAAMQPTEPPAMIDPSAPDPDATGALAPVPPKPRPDVKPRPPRPPASTPPSDRLPNNCPKNDPLCFAL